MKKLLFVAVALAGLGLFAAEDYLGVEITSIRQRYPWNGKVDIDFTVASTNPDKPVILTFTAVDNSQNPAVPLKTQSFDGTTTNVFAVMPGTHRTTWDTDLDVPQSVIDNVRFKIAASTDFPSTDDRKYMIVDLRKGLSASATDKYPVTYLPEMPLGLAIGDDKVKTDYLVLRRIPATTSDEWKALSGGKDYFMMGTPLDEPLRKDIGDAIEPIKVKLTKAFYIGIYEFTQRQYELVTGERPSYYRNDLYYAARPVENILANSQVGSATSDTTIFMGMLRSRTGLDFQLPTECEWEYACRAGTTTVWNNGNGFSSDGWGDENLVVLGRFAYNDGNQKNDDPQCEPKYSTALVGSYLPNAWGLYDMHGNVAEMCRDWQWTSKEDLALHWDGYDAETDTWVDPGGYKYDRRDWQTRRGGSFSDRASLNRSSARSAYIGYGDGANKYTGFRIACYVED